MSEQVLIRILDGILLLAQAGLNYRSVIEYARAKADAGATPDEIADMLRDGRVRSEIELQNLIDSKK